MGSKDKWVMFSPKCKYRLDSFLSPQQLHHTSSCRWRSENQTEVMVAQGQRMLPALASTILLVLIFKTLAAGEQCGRQAWGAKCPGDQCWLHHCALSSAGCGYNQGQLPGNMHFAAGGDSGSANIWNHGENCGRTFLIQCHGHGYRGSGAITVKVVDRCPNGCGGGWAFDLSSEAFAAITDPDVGVITVKYSLA